MDKSSSICYCRVCKRPVGINIVNSEGHKWYWLEQPYQRHIDVCDKNTPWAYTYAH